jgi:phage shock protein C
MGRIKKTLHLDRENRKFLGVCAGVANFLEVDATAVRVVYFICCIFGGWFLIPLYFLAWFLLDESTTPMRNSLTDNIMVNHFKNVDYRKKLYRNKREGKIWGVCAGIADYLEVNVFAVRIAALAMVFMAGGFPFLLYLGAMLVLDPKPDYLYDNPPVASPKAGQPGAAAFASQAQGAQGAGKQDKTAPQSDFDRSHFSKRREFQFCAHKFQILHARLARMEAYVTSNRFKLHREFKNIS